MPRTGRPKIEINQDIFEGLCNIQCTLEEISGILRVSEDTIERWCRRTYSRTFADALKRLGATGRESIRRAQFKLALAGNPTMLIWLGKQILGQRDEIRNYNFDLTHATDEQLARISAGEDPTIVLSTQGSSGTREAAALTSDSIN